MHIQRENGETGQSQEAARFPARASLPALFQFFLGKAGEKRGRKSGDEKRENRGRVPTFSHILLSPHSSHILALTHASRTGLIFGSRKRMSGQAAALAARNDRRRWLNLIAVATLRGPSLASARRPPSPLDFYLSWMSPGCQNFHPKRKCPRFLRISGTERVELFDLDGECFRTLTTVRVGVGSRIDVGSVAQRNLVDFTLSGREPVGTGPTP